MRITVIIPRFAITGVPLAQIRFARAFAERGHQVDLLVGYVGLEYIVPDVPGVTVFIWRHARVIGMLFDVMRYLKQAKPDIVFSAEDHLNIVVLMAALLSGSKAKISGSSRVTPYDTYSNKVFSKRWILKQLARLVMWRANALTCVSSDMVEQYQNVFRNPPHVCVYNIVDDHGSRERMKESIDHEWLKNKTQPVLIAAGRLAHWKGFDDLINAFNELIKTKPAKLLILGDGPMRAELQAQIDALFLSEVIRIEGYVENPLKYFVHADVFVLSSHVEGMPNVLVEAMMCGCTPVSTDCPTGPRELLQKGKYGYLVPVNDPIAMAATIEIALDNPISQALLAEAVKPFEDSVVINHHLKLLRLEPSQR